MSADLFARRLAWNVFARFGYEAANDTVLDGIVGQHNTGTAQIDEMLTDAASSPAMTALAERDVGTVSGVSQKSHWISAPANVFRPIRPGRG